MMKCRKVRSKIALRSERQLSHTEAEEIERHLSQCPSCREAAAADEQVAVLLEDMPALTPRDGGWERLQCRIEEEDARRRIPLVRPAYALASIALIVIVLAGIFSAFKPARTPDNLAEREPQKRNQVVKRNPVVAQGQVNEKSETAPDAGQMKAPEVSVNKRHYRNPGSRPVHTVKLPTDSRLKKPVEKKDMRPKVVEQPVPEEKSDEKMVSSPADQTPPVAAEQDISSCGQYVSAEMADLISEGMSVLVEASQELSQNRENQL